MNDKFTVGIPVVSDDVKIWMVRTQSGRYYADFVQNNYVALGWDKINYKYLSKLQTKEAKNNYIKEIYPDEKRPGLILSQIETFTEKIKPGDYIIIPSKGGGSVSLGIANDKVDKIQHVQREEEYEVCNYKMKISVTWIKEIHTYQDVYLFKILRAVQTISDVTKHKDLILRNSYDLFISEDSIHLMLKKTTHSPCMLENRLGFDSAIYTIFENANKLYGVKNQQIEYKTAISSPGFIEIILPMSGSAMLLAMVVALTLKSKNTKDGVSFSGVSAIIKSISDLFNDKVERDLKRKQIQKLDVEIESISIDNEIKKINLQNIQQGVIDSKNITQQIEQISEETKKLHSSAQNLGLSPISIQEKAG